MKNLIVLIVSILTLSFANAQRGKDKIDPVIESSIPSEDGYFIYKSSVHLCVSAIVSDNDQIWGTTFTIDPTGHISYRPERNVGKYLMGTFIQSVSNPSACFGITGLTPGEHELQIDVWDYAKNQTTKTIKFYVIE